MLVWCVRDSARTRSPVTNQNQKKTLSPRGRGRPSSWGSTRFPGKKCTSLSSHLAGVGGRLFIAGQDNIKARNHGCSRIPRKLQPNLSRSIAPCPIRLLSHSCKLTFIMPETTQRKRSPSSNCVTVQVRLLAGSGTARGAAQRSRGPGGG